MIGPMRDLPSGIVTFLFTDIEGSTKLLHELGANGYANALADHRKVLREAFAEHGGVEVDTQGDAFFVAFSDAREALVAARHAQESLSAGPIRVRMGLHTGEPTRVAEGYVGLDVHAGARARPRRTAARSSVRAQREISPRTPSPSPTSASTG